MLAHEARTGRRSLPRRRAYNRSVRRARRRRNTTPLCHRVPAHHSKRHPVRGAPARCRRSSDGKIFALPRLYSRAECGRRAAGGGGFTRRASCAPFQRAPTRAERRRPRGGGDESVNILGTALQACPDVQQDEKGSWTEHSRTCTEQDRKHNICVRNLPKDFATVTVQGDWSKSYPHYHNHCVCNGAYTEYVTSPKEKETLQLKCGAIPGNIDEHNWLWEKTSITDEQRCAALKDLESTCQHQLPQDPQDPQDDHDAALKAFKDKFRALREAWCPNEAADSQAQEVTDEGAE